MTFVSELNVDRLHLNQTLESNGLIDIHHELIKQIHEKILITESLKKLEKLSRQKYK